MSLLLSRRACGDDVRERRSMRPSCAPQISAYLHPALSNCGPPMRISRCPFVHRRCNSRAALRTGTAPTTTLDICLGACQKACMSGAGELAYKTCYAYRGVVYQPPVLRRVSKPAQHVKPSPAPDSARQPARDSTHNVKPSYVLASAGRGATHNADPWHVLVSALEPGRCTTGE